MFLADKREHVDPGLAARHARRMHSAVRFVAVGIVVMLCDCQTSEPSPRLAPRIADKRSVFGDASLVPTREGEHARRELALAGEIERGLRTDPDLVTAHVSVRLADASTSPAVTIRARLSADSSTVTQHFESHARRLVTSIVPGAAAERIDIHTFVEPPPSTPLPMWPLLLMVLGFGASCGVAVERWRSRFWAARS